jgi:hypothetical protein
MLLNADGVRYSTQTMHRFYVHILTVEEDYGDILTYAPKLCQAIRWYASGGLCCLVGAVDANLMAHLTLGLPPHFRCFFRKYEDNREALVVTFTLSILISISCIVFMASFWSAGYSIVWLPNYLFNPFVFCTTLLNTSVIARLLLNSPMGRRWAFALQNEIAFCADERTLDYWRQSKPRRSKMHHCLTTPDITVVRVRDRQVDVMCKLIYVRVCANQETLSDLLIDVIHLARPHVASRRAMAVIVIAIPPKLGQQRIQSMRDALTSVNMWSQCTPSRRALIAVACTHHARWEHADAAVYKRIFLSEDSVLVRLEIASE